MNQEYDISEAVPYHYGKFPPKSLNYEYLTPALTEAVASVAKYDALLDTVHNSDVLLAPLRRREAVISSRIEGTIATLEEVLRYEASEDTENGKEPDQPARQEVLEVFSYHRALNHAQKLIENGLPISSRLLREAHSRLLFFGRGADKTPGRFKTDQNYIVDKKNKKILFVPISVDKLEDGISKLEQYINDEKNIPLIQTAISHAEFESLHPFKDGNGRLGRMLITLMMWNRRTISAPHFYISDSIETRRDEYIDQLRKVSEEDSWTEWCIFFFEIIKKQAEENISIANSIRALYEDMKEEFRDQTGSQWSINALDFVFSQPVFRNSSFVKRSGIPTGTAHRIVKTLSDGGLLTIVEESSGRRPATYAFEPLLRLASA